MSTGEMFYLAMVLTAFTTFVCVMGIISVWSRKTEQRDIVPPVANRPIQVWGVARTYMISHVEQRSTTDRAA